jgi:hypothetical protein
MTTRPCWILPRSRKPIIVHVWEPNARTSRSARGPGEHHKQLLVAGFSNRVNLSKCPCRHGVPVMSIEPAKIPLLWGSKWRKARNGNRFRRD